MSVYDEMNHHHLMSKIIKFGSPRSNHSLSGCWTHITGASSAGYGQITIDGVVWGIHRYSYWVHNGKPELPKGFHVAHKCDNKECSNPEHLELITHEQNCKDAVARIRTIKPKKEKREGNFIASSASFKAGQQTGENNLNSKLNWEKIREIRARYKAGLKYGELKKMAVEYEIAYITMQKIVANKLWVEINVGID